MPWVALAMAGAAALQQQQKGQQERQQRAVDTRYSPWTHITPGNIDPNATALGGAIQGGAAGMAQNQSSQNADAWQQWLKNNGAPNSQQNTMPSFTNGIYASKPGGPFAQSPGPWANANPYVGGDT